MDALSLLLNRRSLPKLVEPAPAGDVLENIFRAGLRAPDHGGLTPWRFIVSQGEGLTTLANILVAAAKADHLDDFVIEKASKAPFRAPMVITVVSKVTSGHKVPVIEQHLSAGCAAQAMQMAAVAQGYSGFWRTGSWAYHPVVREALGVTGEDMIVGFLYLGSIGCREAKVHERDLAQYVEYL
ncbi:NAD(P)H nitroreductase [Photobacterium sp. NCIMB 13483]|uniref:Putative NAD(P)H nitroreductase n=1 Tax=Photobacterium piscicola TaxID=1378299 RepID=A0A1T5I1T2_9GAMM|nr:MULTISPECIES: NAD(P)H nitroreductase [Photobacterium]MEC6822572.1 NAD(P)H nitroreductase [Photobacterium piscicola]MEC6882406.1 NAD(P)H nitroreductase [Photobacterium piscicola]MEC6897947.1 NAD(P)H nitroreductase [Photobacterium piscicola]PST88579.1 NAD(P)H nitroreductase [Photobacterium sp. NCIMB 13483]SKC32972.1 Putative NAD(P)H nitroreductase YdjA [Photobacterium piscicola]